MLRPYAGASPPYAALRSFIRGFVPKPLIPSQPKGASPPDQVLLRKDLCHPHFFVPKKQGGGAPL